jgi:hypothetical protein
MAYWTYSKVKEIKCCEYGPRSLSPPPNSSPQFSPLLPNLQRTFDYYHMDYFPEWKLALKFFGRVDKWVK